MHVGTEHSTVDGLRVKITGRLKECWERTGAGEMVGRFPRQSF